MTDVVEAYHTTQESLGPFVLNVGGSTHLAEQHRHTGRADVFISADALSMQRALTNSPDIEPETLAYNALVAIQRRGAAKAEAPWWLDALSQEGALVIGDDQVVPVGRYARVQLENIRHGNQTLWQALESNRVPLRSARAVLQMVELNERFIGIVYATDAALSDDVAVLHHFPPRVDAPIEVFIAVMNPHSERAADYVAGWRDDRGQTLLRQYGFKTDLSFTDVAAP